MTLLRIFPSLYLFPSSFPPFSPPPIPYLFQFLGGREYPKKCLGRGEGAPQIPRARRTGGDNKGLYWMRMNENLQFQEFLRSKVALTDGLTTCLGAYSSRNGKLVIWPMQYFVYIFDTVLFFFSDSTCFIIANRAIIADRQANWCKTMLFNLFLLWLGYD